jgi:hypothetical protein
MFGFIRPLRSELKVREWERFQSVYCGLCHAIRKRYGILQTTLLSYDCTYLALVLDSSTTECKLCRRRCITHPFRRRSCAQETEGICHAAAVSVILNWHKLQDTLDDEHGWKRLAARLLRLLLRRGYQKAKRDNPLFDHTAAEQLQKLNQIQREQTASLDIPADTFATILRAAVPQERTKDGRVLEELFYHTGRWIYLIDACDDLEDDFSSGNYNPIRLRYQLSKPDLTALRETLNHTLLQSLAASYHAYLLLETKKDSGIIENILCQGLPEVTRQVLNGTWKANGGKNGHGSI